MKKLLVMTALLFSALATAPGYAADCVAPKAGPDLSNEEMETLWSCLGEKLAAGYGKKGHEVGTAYTGWKAASLRPAAPGVHSGQYLMTYVNETGYADYVAFDGRAMPAGTVIAKPSFSIKDNGKIKNGPLLMMTKVGDSAADTGGWEYTGVKPNGKTLKVDAKGFCHACHVAWAHQDSLGYPVPDARVSN